MISPPSPALLSIFAAVFLAMVIGSIIRYLKLRHADPELRRKRFASLRTWWMVAFTVALALSTGRLGVCLLLATAGIFALCEYANLLGIRTTERPALKAAVIITVINYLLLLFGHATIYLVFVPIGGLAIVAVVQLVQGKAADYIRTTGGLFWGLVVIVYGMSHAAYLFLHPAAAQGPAGPAGWFLFLLILTEADDIFQAIIGRAFGAHKRHRIAPVVSPNKTWEGLIGGMLVTILLAALLAPWLTTLSNPAAARNLPLPGFLGAVAGPALAAILITVAGFFGDINMSAIKRDSGVKDSGHMMPGMGGLIDRIDSLTFTAPTFLYFLAWWTS